MRANNRSGVLGRVRISLLGSALIGVFLIASSSFAQQAPSLQISSPASGSVATPGQTLSISVTSPNGTAFSQVAVIGPDPIGFSVLATSVPAQFSIAIPADANCRIYNLTADGITTSGQGATSLPIQIDVERADLPTSLTTPVSDIVLETIGEQRSFMTIAGFSDGTTIDVSESTLMSYTSTNNAVANVDATGLVTAVGAGSAAISASYTLAGKGIQLTVPVQVLIQKLTISQNSLTFPAQALGTTSTPQPVTLTNSSLGAVKILSLSATGDFSETDNCVASSPLPVNGSCTANVSFSPTTGGTQVGKLSVANGANIVPISISLTGTGTGTALTPAITTVSPSSGAVGTPVTITGTNFAATQGTSAVTFNSTPAIPTSWNSTSMVVPVPSGATTGNVVVTVGGVASNGISFTVTAPAPSITSLSPTAGVVGTSVIIAGVNFRSTQGTSTVKFNGTTAPPTSWSATSIVVPVPSGATTGNVAVTVGGVASNGVTFTVTAPGTFVSTSNMVTARDGGSSATLLNNGMVLIVGGYHGYFCGQDGSCVPNVLVNAELYNPATGIFTVTGNLTTARTSHTATLLSNGMVLIAGGNDGYDSLKSAELYNPATGAFTATGNLIAARDTHTATLLNNGQVVLVGGFSLLSGITRYLSSGELYNPATGTFTATGSLHTARGGHTAILLNTGKVLVAGGNNRSSLSSAELYNPGTGTFTTTGNLITARDTHTATLLNNGQVVLVGGFNVSNGTTTYLSSGELYNPATGTFTATGSLSTARASHTATLLKNGTALVAGGFDSGGAASKSAELYNPTTGTFTKTGNLNVARANHTATLLTNGMVILASGDSSGTAELYQQ